MATKKKAAKKDRKPFAQVISEMMIEKIETGEIVSWDSGIVGHGVPRNAMTGAPYRGINVLLGYWLGGGETRFLTTNQANLCRDKDPNSPGFIGYEKDESDPEGIKRYKKDAKLGKKGDPMLCNVFADYEASKKKAIRMVKWVVKGETSKGKDDGYMFPVSFTVYPISCFRGLSPAKLASEALIEMIDHSDQSAAIDAAETICAGYFGGAGKGPKIVYGDFSSGSFSPSEDLVRMSNRYASKLREMKTKFHEGIHSTGMPDRLNRKPIADRDFTWGDHAYSKEELIAELGAAILCGQCGFLPEVADNSAAYLKSWLGVLKADPKLLLSSAGAAQKAVDYIVGYKWEAPEEIASAA